MGDHVSLVKNEQEPPSHPASPPQYMQPIPPQQPAYVDRQEMAGTKFQPIPDNRSIQVIRGTKSESVPLN